MVVSVNVTLWFSGIVCYVIWYICINIAEEFAASTVCVQRVKAVDVYEC
jgi:phage shock protein PspC (stress-responsive transcriptional regulator)